MRPSQPANASEEGDMAQADEMGEGDGRDDGFVEGSDSINNRRRNKKRPGMWLLWWPFFFFCKISTQDVRTPLHIGK